jgi:phenylalanyl-tRNA synthetase beta chain
MKFSEAWLREWVSPDISTDELVAQITMAGLEVDAVTPVADEFSQVVVGEILSTDAHPNADRLKVCTVSAGEEQFQVVCGAPNAKAGMKVPFALVGAKLADFDIKMAKLRGVESFGMLCSERELGLSDDHEGLMELPHDAPIGVAVRDYLGLDDCTIEVDLTPNRSDCLGVIGIARETGLLNDLDLTPPEMAPVEPTISDTFPVTLTAREACPRFVGRVIKGIDITAESPLWLREKLRRSGLRSIDPVVDITNYVMLELNQPMHAYDLGALTTGIEVRLAEAGEKLTLLNQAEVTLNDSTLLITDASGPVGMAGVMGGLSTAVKPSTRDVFFEAAFFAPEAIAGRARQYGLHTDAGHRFERGVDFEGQSRAIERATRLLIDIAGGDAGPLVDTVEADHLPARAEVLLRASRVTKVLGMNIEPAVIENSLFRLGFGFEPQSGDEVAWLVQAPSHRFDINIEADLIEEISRIVGYDELPVTRPFAELSMLEASEAKRSSYHLIDQMIARGFSEAINYSFVDASMQAAFTPSVIPAMLKNPLSSEMDAMRTSLLPGLLRSATFNHNRQQLDVRLFELGRVFSQFEEGEPTMATLQQTNKIAAVLTGDRLEESWANEKTAVDFFDLKGDLEAVFGSEYLECTAAVVPGFEEGQTASVLFRGEAVGVIGKIDASVQSAFGLKAPCYAFELVAAPMLGQSVPVVNEISKFPEIRRDIALLVDREVTAAELRQTVHEAGGEALTKVRIFDVYQGKGIDNQRKSVGLGLTFQEPSRTLKDEEVAEAMANVVTKLEQTYQAQLR